MAKEMQVNESPPHNDNSAPKPDRLPQESDDKRGREDNQGKALQMNENSLGGKEPARPQAPSRRGSGGEPNEQKLQGKALQVNENSVEEDAPANEG